MGTISIWHIALILLAVSTLIPAAKILRRAGFSPWWAVLYLLPVVSWVALWIFAFARWPTAGRDGATAASDG